MSDQTATNQQAETVLCKMGCGFFGNGTTGGCCSKCWRSAQKKDEIVHQSPPKQMEAEVVIDATLSEDVSEEPAPMDVDLPKVEEAAPMEESKPTAEAPKKRKKKKASYKNMMASVLKSPSPSRDIEKEKETLRNVTGGGAFSKIEKI